MRTLYFSRLFSLSLDFYPVYSSGLIITPISFLKQLRNLLERCMRLAMMPYHRIVQRMNFETSTQTLRRVDEGRAILKDGRLVNLHESES